MRFLYIWLFWHCDRIIVVVCLHDLPLRQVFRCLGDSVLKLLFRHLREWCRKWGMHNLCGRFLPTKHNGCVELHRLRSWDIELNPGGVITIDMQYLPSRILLHFLWPVLVYGMRCWYICRIRGDWLQWLRRGTVSDHAGIIELHELRCGDLLRDVGVVHEQLRELPGGSNICLRYERLYSVWGRDVPAREFRQLRVLWIRHVFSDHRCKHC